MSQPITLPELWAGHGADADTPTGYVTVTGLQEFNTPVYLVRGTSPWDGELLGVVLVHPDGSPRQTTTYRADKTRLAGDGDLKTALHRLADDAKEQL